MPAPVPLRPVKSGVPSHLGKEEAAVRAENLDSTILAMETAENSS